MVALISISFVVVVVLCRAGYKNKLTRRQNQYKNTHQEKKYVTILSHISSYLVELFIFFWI